VTTKGARWARHESATTRSSRKLARGSAGRCGFALGRTERQLRKPCRSLIRKHQNSESTECAETAGSVRGAVVHPVCPCSLTVAEVGRRRRLDVDAFGCGWKRTGRASPKRLRATGEGTSDAGPARSPRGRLRARQGLPTGGRRLGSGIHRLFNGAVGQTVLVAEQGAALRRTVRAARRRGVRTQLPFGPRGVDNARRAGRFSWQ
jgi:hypothetical protein